MTRRRLTLAVALAGVLLGAAPAGAQSIFDIFGDDAPPARRSAPREVRRPPSAAPKAKKPTVKRSDAARTAPAGAPATPGAGPDGPSAPYEPQMMRLSEILGALSFLRDMCGAGDGADWRAKASALVDAEAPTPARRERLTGAFNRGFRGYELTYRACTPSAKAVVARYLEEASRLSREISEKYGNP